MNRIFKSKILLLIILIAAFLRLWQLGSVPAGLHVDEAAWGYNAYSIMKTGKDEFGKSFPIVLRSFDDYKSALYSYLDIPFIKIFDLTPFAVRLPSAIVSIFTIVIIYFFTKKILKNKTPALVAAFLTAISPWHITLSRTTADFNIALFFTMLMSYSLLMLKEKFSKFWLCASILTGIFSMISYTASRFFVILLVGLFFLFSINKIKNRLNFNKSTFIVLILIIIFGFIYNTLDSASRFRQIDIFSSPGTKLVLEEQIREDEFFPPLQTRSFHNKAINYARTILKNYGEYFTLDFLFLNGGYPHRERIPDTGLLYLWQLLFLLIGIFTVIQRKSKEGIFLLMWWLILLLPIALTFDEIPNVHRSLMVLPPIIIFISIGIYEFFKYKWILELKIISRVLLIFIIMVGSFEFSYYLHQYYVHQEVHRPWYRGYIHKPLMDYLNKSSGNYEKIVLSKSNVPYIYILFYSKYDPKTYQSEGSTRDGDYTGFGKYYFYPKDCPILARKQEKNPFWGKEKILYVNKDICSTPINANLLKSIYWQDNSLALKIMEYIPGYFTSLRNK